MIEVIPSAVLSENLGRYVVARTLSDSTGMACRIPCPPALANSTSVPGKEYCNPIWSLDGDWPRIGELNSPFLTFPQNQIQAKILVSGRYFNTNLFPIHGRDRIRDGYFFEPATSSKRCVLIATRQSNNLKAWPTFPSPMELSNLIPHEREHYSVLLPAYHSRSAIGFQKLGFTTEICSPTKLFVVAVGALELWVSKVPLHWWAAYLCRAKRINVFQRVFRPSVCERLNNPAQVGEFKIHFNMQEAVSIS